MVEFAGIPNAEYIAYAIGGIILFYIIFRFFKGSGESRLGEEREELGIEGKEKRLTKQEVSLVEEENLLIYDIIRRLKEINAIIKQNKPVPLVRVGATSLNVDKAVEVLVYYLGKLIDTPSDMRKEEATLQQYTAYWTVVWHGLMINSVIVQADINKISADF